MILCIELMFFSVGLNFIFFGVYLINPVGFIFSLLTITVATTDTTIGLSLLIIASRLGNKTNYNSLVTLRG
jgi:NADH:ubiquinone oxidoreductase subunit K